MEQWKDSQQRQSMEGVTELQGDGIDVGNLAYCQGRVKLSKEPTCSKEEKPVLGHCLSKWG